MPSKPMRICNHPGCSILVESGYCDKHKKQVQKARDQHRGSAHQRGYTYRWYQYTKVFLSRPENVFCKLQLPGCNNIAECVDHIDPPNGPYDTKFWDTNNHQGACIHCNSVKGRKKIIGTAQPFEADMRCR